MLTPRMREVLDLLIRGQRENGVTPTMQEIADELGIRSRSGIHRVIQSLVERGYVRRMPNKARAVEVIEDTIVRNEVPGEALVAVDGAFVSVLCNGLNDDGIVCGDVLMLDAHRPCRSGDLVVILTGRQPVARLLLSDDVHAADAVAVSGLSRSFGRIAA